MSVERNQDVTHLIRRQRIWDMYVQGKSQSEIATEMQVTQQAISQTLRRITQDSTDNLLESVVEHKIKQAARLEYLYQQAMLAWESSRKDKSRRGRRWRAASAAAGAGPGATDEQNEVILESAFGDPRFLDTARGILSDIRRMWGLDAPIKQQVLVATLDLSKLSDQELMQARLLSEKLHGPADDQ
jgi:predicted DNA-binding protein YlxM (UPF0122 family)